MQTIRYTDRNTEQCWSCKRRTGEGFTGKEILEYEPSMNDVYATRPLFQIATLYEVAPECRITGKLMLNVYDEKCRYYEKKEE